MAGLAFRTPRIAARRVAGAAGTHGARAGKPLPHQRQHPDQRLSVRGCARAGPGGGFCPPHRGRRRGARADARAGNAHRAAPVVEGRRRGVGVRSDLDCLSARLSALCRQCLAAFQPSAGRCAARGRVRRAAEPVRPGDGGGGRIAGPAGHGAGFRQAIRTLTQPARAAHHRPARRRRCDGSAVAADIGRRLARHGRERAGGLHGARIGGGFVVARGAGRGSPPPETHGVRLPRGTAGLYRIETGGAPRSACRAHIAGGKPRGSPPHAGPRRRRGGVAGGDQPHVVCGPAQDVAGVFRGECVRRISRADCRRAGRAGSCARHFASAAGSPARRGAGD